MFKSVFLGVIALSALIAGSAFAAAPEVQVLEQNWSFRLAPDDANVAVHPEVAGWLKATVPGTAQTDLLAAGKLPDPYMADNEAKVQWVGLSDWQYKTDMTVSAA